MNKFFQLIETARRKSMGQILGIFVFFFFFGVTIVAFTIQVTILFLYESLYFSKTQSRSELWGVSAKVNSYFGIFATHSLTNPTQA